MQRRVAGFSLTEILFFLLSLIYLAAEFRFNAVLLDAAGSAVADSVAIERAADFGRIVSGFGFTLLALGLFTGARFRLTQRRERIIFGGLAVLCVAPFLVFPPQDHEMLFVVPVAFGLFLIAVSRGRFLFHTILALCLMTWPAMYAGQKSMIEHMVVEPTSWQQREQARNALMLKAGLENCVVEVEDQWLCKGDKSTAEIRAVRAMIAALWMHNPADIMAALAPQRDSIIERSVRQTGDSAMTAAYDQYMKGVTDQRRQVVDEMIETLYKPYQEASRLYTATQDPQKLNAEVNQIWQQMERETDLAWDDYLYAQGQYQKTIGRYGDTMLTREGMVFEKLDEFCATRDCPGRERGLGDRATLRLLDEAETRFIRKTGFPPNVASKAQLMTYPKARDAFEAKVNADLVKRLGTADAVLPANWVYEEVYMKGLLTQLMRNEAARQWQAKFGTKLPPNLPMDEFFTRMEIPPVPAVDTLLMTREAFAENYTLPHLREKMRGTMTQMEQEAPLYANGAALEHQGRDYIRAVYIPAIALLLSLMIVLLTLMRGINAGLRHALPAIGFLKRQGVKAQRRLRRGIMALLLAGVAIGPFFITNSYTQSAAYQVYVREAAAENIITATLLDWAIHVQPLIYALVQPFLD